MAVDAASVSVNLGMVGFQKEAEKGAPNGYAPLDANSQVPLANIPVGAGGPPAWGEVTGTLANQTDLQSALDGKEAAGTAAAAVATHAGLPDPHPNYALDTDLSNHVAAGDPHPTYALDADLSAHVAAGDPHTVYALDSDLAAHVAAADPHTGYQRESEKAAALGYASLDAGALVPVAQLPALSALSGAVTDGQIPATIARDTEVATAVSDHAAAADPHTGYQKESEKNAASGYAGLDGSTKLAGAQQTYGTLVDTACQGNDARLSDARTPLAHKTSHQDGGSDELSVVGLSGLLADGQTPLAHKTSHQSGGSDAIKLDDLAAPDDNTDLNASLTAHGLLQKLPGGTTTFLRADGSFAAPPAGSGITTYATGTQTTATGNFLLLVKRMSLTTTQRYTGQGTARLRIT